MVIYYDAARTGDRAGVSKHGLRALCITNHCPPSFITWKTKALMTLQNMHCCDYFVCPAMNSGTGLLIRSSGPPLCFVSSRGARLVRIQQHVVAERHQVQSMNILWYERVEFSEFIQNGLEAVTHLTADPGREVQLQAFTSHIGHAYVCMRVLGTGKHTHTHTHTHRASHTDFL